LNLTSSGAVWLVVELRLGGGGGSQATTAPEAHTLAQRGAQAMLASNRARFSSHGGTRSSGCRGSDDRVSGPEGRPMAAG